MDPLSPVAFPHPASMGVPVSVLGALPSIFLVLSEILICFSHALVEVSLVSVVSPEEFCVDLGVV
jgi:hypothetical protein